MCCSLTSNSSGCPKTTAIFYTHTSSAVLWGQQCTIIVSSLSKTEEEQHNIWGTRQKACWYLKGKHYQGTPAKYEFDVFRGKIVIFNGTDMQE